MPNNREIYQCANLVIEQYGDEGSLDHCEQRIKDLISNQDTKGADVWRGIRVAVGHLLGGAPGPDEVVH